MVRSFQCFSCKKRIKPKDRRPLTEEIRQCLQKTQPLNATPSKHDAICPVCRQRCRRKLQSRTPTRPLPIISLHKDPTYEPPRPSTSKQLFKSPLTVKLNIQSTSRCHSRCFVCKRPGPKLVKLSSEGRLNAFLEHNVIIPSDTRCCPVHTVDGSLQLTALQTIQTMTDASYFNRTSLNELLQNMRTLCNQGKKSLNFDDLSDSNYPSLTKLTRVQFDDICDHLSDKIKTSPRRSIRTTIGIFLLKLSSGISNDLLSTMLSLTKSSVRRAIETVRHAFMRGFVPLYLGIDAITRQEIITKHTRDLAKSLFGASDDSVILVLDGTYIYINKSNNFHFQRRTYSMHKGRPLVKPMVVVTTTGHFVTIIGPYLSDSKNNDASILNHMFRSNVEDFKDFTREGDIFVVDRGFRDSLQLLKDMGIQAEMPALLQKGKKQMDPLEANSSRLVTKIRWVVESANARLKRFKYLDRVMPNSQLPFIGDFVRIVAAISNKYFPPLCTSSPHDQEMADKMISYCKTTNSLKSVIEEKGFDKIIKRNWNPVQDFQIAGFPQFCDEELRELTFGVYQLRMSSSYMQEHLEGNCDFLVHVDEPQLLCVKMQSRHISSRNYKMWIQFNENAVTAWYCQCKAGARVVGMCSHIAAIVWYLSSGRYQENECFGVRDWSIHLSDAACIQLSDSSSDSD